MKKIYSMLGIMLLACMSFAMAETTIDVEFDVGDGDLTVDVEDSLLTDAEATASFYGEGFFKGRFQSNNNNANSLLNTEIEADGNSYLAFKSSHNLGANNNNDHKMVFQSEVGGDYAAMRFKVHNSLQQSQIERVAGAPMLYAEGFYGMGYTMTNTKRDDSYSNAGIAVNIVDGFGTGALGKTKYGSNHLARGIGYNSNALDVRDGEVVATGEGQFTQSAFGDNSLKMNGFTFGSGNANFVANFAGGLTGEYSAYAR